MQTSGSAELVLAGSAERTEGDAAVGATQGCRCAASSAYDEERTERGALAGWQKVSQPAALCACSEKTAPVLVLALGNPLMSDDGAGQELLARLESEAANWGTRVELMDGGTQGLALLGKFEEREAVVFLDAIRLGDRAGTVHVLQGDELVRLGGGRAKTAHEGSAPQILAALQLLGEVPREVVMVGIEPEEIKTGIGLSASVGASIGVGATSARMMVNRVLAGIS